MKRLIFICAALSLYFWISFRPQKDESDFLSNDHVDTISIEAKACAKDVSPVIWVIFDTVTDVSSHAILLRLADIGKATDKIARLTNISVYDQIGRPIGTKAAQIYPSARFIPISVPLRWYLEEPKFLKIEFTPVTLHDCIYVKRQS